MAHSHQQHHGHEHPRQPVGGCGGCPGCSCESTGLNLTGPEEKSWVWKDHWLLIASALLTLCLIVIDAIDQIDLSPYLRVPLYVAAYLAAAYPVLLEAGRELKAGNVFNEFSLMSLATFGAFYLGEYAEGVTVMLFYCIGELFQDAAVDHARRSIKKLLDIRPDRVTVERDGQTTTVQAAEVKIGETIRIKPDEKVALDGVLLSPQADFNTAALTGESKPDTRRAGEPVLAGMINGRTACTIRVTAAYADTVLSRVLHLVEDATARKSKVQLFITRFARIYTPAVILLALLIIAMPYFFVADYQFDQWFYRALVFLVLSCPCALVISIPLGYFGGISLASRHGVLFKGANYLDALRQIDCVVLDKTGTLTRGVFKVAELIPAEAIDPAELLAGVIALERHSNHPIARALLEFAPQADAGVKATDLREIPGRGLEGTIGGRQFQLGNPHWLAAEGIAVAPVSLETPQTVVALARDRQYLGCIIIADELKPDAKQAVAGLKAAHLQTVVLSGDRGTLVEALGRELQVDAACGDLLPQDKLAKVQALVDAGHKVAFVGDGVNDAPAIALAQVGIAMGGLGSDGTIEVADVVIQNDQPSKLLTALQVSHLTRNVVVQNIALAMGVKGIVLLLGGFGMATLWEAVFADVGVALLAILNAVRLQRQKLS